MALDLPPKTSAKIDAMIRLLASDKDGEVVNAARAIGRLLKAAGKSFHDLADAVAGKGGAMERRAYEPAYSPYNAWDPPYEDRERPPAPRWGDLRPFERLDWISAILKKLTLDAGDQDAVTKLRFQLINRRDQGVIRAQVALFNRLMARAWKVGVRP